MKRIALLTVACLCALTSATSSELELAEVRKKDKKKAKAKIEHKMERREEPTKAIKVLSAESKRVGERIELDFYIDYNKLELLPNEQLIVTPYITDFEGNELDFRPAIFMGERVARHRQNKEARYEKDFGVTDPYEVVVLSKSDMKAKHKELRETHGNSTYMLDEMVLYRANFPYQRWMNESEVMLDNVFANVRSEIFNYDTEIGTLYNRTLPQIVFITPDVEIEKKRSETMTARIVFDLDKYDIKSEKWDNRAEIEKMYEFTDNIISNNDLTFNDLTLTGYASPEGRYAHNTNLAKNRVNAVKNMLDKKYSSYAGRGKIESVPEDWDSVRRWVAASDIRYKNEIINIIDQTPQHDARDAKIRALDNGETYRMLLRDVYPGLRRTEYTIHYTVAPFTVEKGMTVMRTNPNHLSLHEFYMIAMTYPEDSQEYQDVMSTALRYYPNDPIANHNMATAALRNRDVESARRYLSRVSDNDARSLNNLGVLYALEGNYIEAERTFQRAIAAGSKEASANLENMRSF